MDLDEFLREHVELLPSFPYVCVCGKIDEEAKAIISEWWATLQFSECSCGRKQTEISIPRTTKQRNKILSILHNLGD
jgi:hypothetical protein